MEIPFLSSSECVSVHLPESALVREVLPWSTCPMRPRLTSACVGLPLPVFASAGWGFSAATALSACLTFLGDSALSFFISLTSVLGLLDAALAGLALLQDLFLGALHVGHGLGDELLLGGERLLLDLDLG